MIHYAVQREENGWFSLQTRRELLDYCYYVAGTVGLMLTDLWKWHHPFLSKKCYEALRSRSVAFGLGLQLVNISRDIPADWKRKTVFVPRELCQLQGIVPDQLTDLASRTPAMAVLTDMMRMAQKELLESQKYVLTLPRWALRVRLFCLWPLLMAQDSLIALAQSGVDALDPAKRVKIGRKQVKNILVITTLFCGSNTLLNILFQRRNQKLQALLGVTKF
jgi:farnesyl-diphosphate farnesyltransferase